MHFVRMRPCTIMPLGATVTTVNRYPGGESRRSRPIGDRTSLSLHLSLSADVDVETGALDIYDAAPAHALRHGTLGRLRRRLGQEEKGAGGRGGCDG